MVQMLVMDMLTNLDNIPVIHKNVHRMATGVLILNGQKAPFAHEAVAGDLVACLVNDSV
jgi:hypothetical protein